MAQQHGSLEWMGWRNAAAAVLLGLGLGVAWGQGAGSKPQMDWMTMDLPPVLMIENGQPTNGFVDAILKLLFAEMPEVQHRIQVLPVARLWSNLSRGLPMCFVTPLRTREREEIAYFTSTQLIPPIQLVVREDVVDRLPRNAKGEVLPQALFNSPQLRGLVTSGRGYTQSIDTLLNQRVAESGVRETVAADSGSNVLQMLGLGRADYTLEFDYVVTYLRERYPQLQQGAPLKSLPIAGALPQIAGIACPHTEWGRTTIMKLDAIVARISQRPEYQAALHRWLTPETARRYQKEMADFYRLRARPTDISFYPVWPDVR
jgi:uncharacterized protein (TIGR02285 family)